VIRYAIVIVRADGALERVEEEVDLSLSEAVEFATAFNEGVGVAGYCAALVPRLARCTPADMVRLCNGASAGLPQRSQPFGEV